MFTYLRVQRRLSALLARVEELEDQLQEQRRELTKLRDAQDGVTKAFERLRGRFYGSLGGRPRDAPSSVDDIPTGDYSALHDYAAKTGQLALIPGGKS